MDKIKRIKNILLSGIKPGWEKFLKEQLDQGYFNQLIIKLIEFKDQRKDVYPKPDQVFKIFQLVEPKDIMSVVVIPHITEGFNRKSRYADLMWKINTMIENECYDGLMLNFSDQTDYLTEQGVFFLPTIMTHGVEPHYHIGWGTFAENLLKYLDQSLNSYTFVYSDECLEYMKHIKNPKHKIISMKDGCFKELDTFVKETYNITIKW